MEALDKMWAKKEAFDREKEKKKDERFMAALELEKKKVEADLMEKEDKIMSMDMTSSSLTPTQLQYYQIMQAKIVARRCCRISSVPTAGWRNAPSYSQRGSTREGTRRLG